jgi:uncharacterized repeat protein (TIGR02543 family)
MKMRALIVRRIKSLIAGTFAVLFLGTLTGAAQAAFTVTVENSNPTGGVVTSSTGLIDCGISCSDSTFQNNTNVTLTADTAFGFIFSGWTNITCSPTTPACTPPSCDNATGVCEIIKGANNKTYFVTASFTAVPIDGVCGSSNGGTFTIAPDTNLCSAGSATAVMGSGPWNWSCTGANGGTTASCSAEIQTYTVTPSAGSNGNITLNTPVTVNHGLTTQFTVTANEGHTAAVGGTCGGTLTGSTYTTNAITANCTVEASFTANQHTLTVNTAGLGSGTVGGGGTYAYGTVNQVTATADAGSTFTGWSGDCSGTDSPYSVTMLDRAMTCTATFTLNTYTVTFQTDGNGTIDGTTPQTINHGGSATAVTANANSGYQFVNWTGTGGFVMTTSNPLAVSNVTADMTITANFTNSPVDGVCGADDGQTLTAAPILLCSAGDATEVTGDGHPWIWDCTGANGGTTASCSAEIQTYTVTPSAGSNGNITPNTPVTVNHGLTTQFTVTANEGHTAAVGGTCGGTLTGSTYTTNAITANCTVEASFTANQHTLTVNTAGLGSGTVGGGGTYAYGTVNQVTAAADAGSIFTGWSGDCSGTESPFQVTMLDRAMTCTANFADISDPELVVSTLSDGSWTSNETLNVSGTAIDTVSGLHTLTVNGTLVTVNPDGEYSTALTLADGPNVITVTAKDQAGNETTETRTIYYDPYAPVIIIEQPADNSKTASPVTVISGYVDEYSEVTGITNNTAPVIFGFDEETGDFTSDVSLFYGLNTIEVKAEDLAGNTASAVRTVIYDNLAPELSITDPSEDMTTSDPDITIRGEVNDVTVVIVRISIDGSEPEALTVTDGSFEKALTFTEQRLYAITVTASDELENSSTVTRNVIYEIAVTPTEPNTAPAGCENNFNIVVNGMTASFTDASSDPGDASARVYVNWGDGSALEPGDLGASFSHAYANYGTYTITKTVKDGDGALCRATATATVSNPVTAATGTLTINSTGGQTTKRITYYVKNAAGTTVKSGYFNVGSSSGAISLAADKQYKVLLYLPSGAGCISNTADNVLFSLDKTITITCAP